LGTLSVLVRALAADLHPFEIAFFRNLAQLIFMLPWVMVAGFGVMRTRRIGAHIRRSSFGILAMLSMFWVLTKMPIAEAIAITFSAPLFTTLGAALFLKESIGVRRWAATLVGFLGVLIIIRPGLRDVSEPHLVAIVCAMLIAGAMLSNKSLSKSENPYAMVVWMGLLMSLLSLAPALTVWQWPAPNVWLWLGVLGVVATAAHLALNQANVKRDASFIAPFGFVQIPFVAVLGYLIFNEAPDLWTWVGAIVIMGSGVYTVRREAKLKRWITVPQERLTHRV
jgi:drug/metabolite transporter (DMT)-like permease